MANGRPRDFQRTKVYRAEWALPHTPLVGTHEEFVRQVEASPVWRNLCWRNLHRPITVQMKPRSNNVSSAWARKRLIQFGWNQYHRTVETVLHEMAHVATYDVYGRDVPSHGAEFTGVLLTLLGVFHPEQADRLRSQYRTLGVKFSQMGLNAHTLQPA